MTPTLVLLAAGLSTRYGRLKQLEPVGPHGEALLDYAVFDARKAGFLRVLLVIRRELDELFRAYVRDRWPSDLEVVFHHQQIDDLPGLDADVATAPPVAALVEGRKKPWGTAHALLTAQRHLDGPFVLLNADDFYGDEGFSRAADFQQATDSLPAPTFGLITYTLGDTLSAHGGVSRGVCEVDGAGWLLGVREVLEIREGGGGISGRTVQGRPVALTGLEPISTNFWIFTPVVFPLLVAAFPGFLQAHLESSSAPPEFLIPTVVNSAIQAGLARVKTIPTSDRFLGITHPEDRPGVMAGLEDMTKEGQYPSPLWG
jgi:hypothetical protein